MSQHDVFMHRCLHLASNGLGHTLSNPLVGCVIIKDNRIIGEGYHHSFGGAHAEVIAWENAGKPNSLKNCTVYVNLEPCTHVGKTPPCADLLIRLNPASVVIAQTDPNPIISGKGIEKLKSAGIQVETGVLEKEARFLNRRFNTYYKKKRPYIILKWAQTANGFVAPLNQEPGKRYVISNEYMHSLVHVWRSQEMGILVGIGTVMQDDPELTVRLINGKTPVRIVLDRNLEIPSGKKVFNQAAPTLVFNCKQNKTENNTEWIKLKEESFSVDVLNELWKRGIISLFVEGGPTLFKYILEKNCWDEMRIITSPSVLVNGIDAPKPAGKIINTNEINGDKLEIRINES